MSTGGEDQIGEMPSDAALGLAGSTIHRPKQSNSLDDALISQLEHVAASMTGGTKSLPRNSLSDSWGEEGGEQWKAPGRNSALLNMAFVTASESEGGAPLSPSELMNAAESFERKTPPPQIIGDGGAASASDVPSKASGAGVPSVHKDLVRERAQSDAAAVGAEGVEESEIGRNTMLRVTKRTGWAGIREQLKTGKMRGASPWGELRKELSVGKGGRLSGMKIDGAEIAKFNADPAKCSASAFSESGEELRRRVSLELATHPDQLATKKKACASTGGGGGSSSGGGGGGDGGADAAAVEGEGVAAEASNHHPNASTHAGPQHLHVQPEQADWRQLAGHADNFAVPDDTRYILKLKSKIESEALSAAMSCAIAKLFAVPFYGTATTADSEKEWMKIGNLLHAFKNPSLMDIKMGQRTYLHDKKNTTKKRMDLLQKMIKVDPSAPTEEEKKEGVTKQRYMRFREEQSSSIELGFRIEAMHVTAHEDENALDNAHGSTFSKYFVPKNKVGVTGEIRRFLMKNPVVRQKFIERLEDMKRLLPQSDFFNNHEVIGSSLLFVYDENDNATVTMLDFGKTVRSPQPLKHNVPYVYPTLSHEEGYLVGVDNILKIIKAIDTEGD